VPYDQNPNTGPSFVVRGSRQALAPATLRGLLRDVDPRIALQGVIDLEQAIERSYGPQRYRTILVSAFGLIAAMLAALGLHGVSARTAARRLREVGVRVALGSSARAVTGLLVRDAMKGVALGVLLGVPLASLAAVAAKKFLFGVSPMDPATLILVSAFLAAVSILSCASPARRAARTSPAVVLRSD
jgi:putative ABC transport system permease protein